MKRGIIKRIPAIMALLVMCLIFGLYVDGWFDISFIVRDDGTADTSSGKDETAGESETPGTQPDVTSADNDDVTMTAPGDVTEPPETGPVMFPAEGELGEQYAVSYADWTPDGDMVLAELECGDGGIGLPNYFTSHKKTVEKVTYVDDPERKPDKVVYEPITVDAAAVTLYMGYIIVETDSADRVNIYSSDGEPLGSFDPSAIVPAYCRDRAGNPLFLFSDTYYRLDAESSRFVAADYDPTADNRGAMFDYTPDYGVSDVDGRQIAALKETIEERVPVEGSTDTFYVVKRYNYTFAPANADGETIGSRRYRSGYQYSESLAAVVDAEGHVSFLSPSGSVSIKTSKTYTDVTLGRSVIEFFAEPLSNGPETMGFYFFDHGLARIRVLTQDRSRYNRGQLYVISDDNVIINTRGQKFYIPIGYEVISYSSGMILLRGDSGCGYMDYTGKWVVDPTLDEAEPFYEGLAVVREGGKCALIDTSGDVLIPYGQFEYISNASTGVIAAYGGDGWHILHKMAPVTEGE